MAERRDQKAAAGYLAELTREMRLIAERHDLKVLSYLLGLAEADAQVQANQDVQANQTMTRLGRRTVPRRLLELAATLPKGVVENLRRAVQSPQTRNAQRLENSCLDLQEIVVKPSLNQNAVPVSLRLAGPVAEGIVFSLNEL